MVFLRSRIAAEGVFSKTIVELEANPCGGRNWKVAPASDRLSFFSILADLFSLVSLRRRQQQTNDYVCCDSLYQALIGDETVQCELATDKGFRGGLLSPIGLSVLCHRGLLECGDREKFVQVVHGWGAASFTLKGADACLDDRPFQPMGQSTMGPQRVSYRPRFPYARRGGSHVFREDGRHRVIRCFSCGGIGHRSGNCPTQEGSSHKLRREDAYVKDAYVKEACNVCKGGNRKEVK